VTVSKKEDEKGNLVSSVKSGDSRGANAKGGGEEGGLAGKF